MPYEHLIVLNDHFLSVAAGDIDRLIVEMPPRHGKSESASRYLPAWYLGTFPDRQVMLASYEATFARSWGRKARDVLDEHGLEIFGVRPSLSPRAADWWEIEHHSGVMVTAGVGGALTGKGADLLLIDDPVKNAEQAQSPVYRQKAWDWWQSTASTRLMPGGAVIVTLTRWHEDDLAGRLLSEEGDRWTVLKLPALAEADDPLGRAEGEPLCPEMFEAEALEKVRRQVGGYWFAALYQQRPAPAEGFMFKRADLRYWREEQDMVGAITRRWYVLADDDGQRRFDTGQCATFQTSDVAMSSRETADWTVIATWAATPDGDLILLDLERRHFEEQQTVQFLAAANDKHGRPPLWIERFGAGRNPLARLAQDSRPVMEIPIEAGTQLDKTTRAFGAVALCEAHRLWLPHGQPEWLAKYENELASFPNAEHDDQVDATSYAARLVPRMRPAGQSYQQQTTARPVTAGLRNQRF